MIAIIILNWSVRAANFPTRAVQIHPVAEPIQHDDIWVAASDLRVVGFRAMLGKIRL